MLAARLSAKCAKGEIHLLSGSDSGAPAQKEMEKRREARKLPRHAD
jgi:hypothetical protein